jgi:hypothetical protein
MSTFFHIRRTKSRDEWTAGALLAVTAVVMVGAIVLGDRAVPNEIWRNQCDFVTGRQRSYRDAMRRVRKRSKTPIFE